MGELFELGARAILIFGVLFLLFRFFQQLEVK